MSNSLVHKSLELVWDTELHRTRKNRQSTAHASHEKDSVSVTDHKKRLRREQRQKKKCKNIKYKGVLDLIPAKHRINSASDDTDISTILSKSSKTVYETQKHIAAQQDPTDDNIRRLLSLSNYSLNPETASNLFKRAVKERYKKKEKKKEPAETVFTEEDFKKFEQEYQDDRQRGKAILILTLISFLYYTIWIIGLPFIDHDRLRSLFYSQNLALMIPASAGLIFIGGLILFTVYHVKPYLSLGKTDKAE